MKNRILAVSSAVVVTGAVVTSLAGHADHNKKVEAQQLAVQHAAANAEASREAAAKAEAAKAAALKAKATPTPNRYYVSPSPNVK